MTAEGVIRAEQRGWRSDVGVPRSGMPQSVFIRVHPWLVFGLAYARGPKSEIGGLERLICVNLCPFAVVFGVPEAPEGQIRAENGNFNRKWTRMDANEDWRRGFSAGKQEFCRKTGGDGGLNPVFLYVPCFPAWFLGCGGPGRGGLGQPALPEKRGTEYPITNVQYPTIKWREARRGRAEGLFSSGRRILCRRRRGWRFRWWRGG